MNVSKSSEGSSTQSWLLSRYLRPTSFPRILGIQFAIRSCKDSTLRLSISTDDREILIHFCFHFTLISYLSIINKTPTQALTPPAEKIGKSLTYTARNAQVASRLLQACYLAVIKPISGCVRIACSGLTITGLLQVVNRLDAI